MWASFFFALAREGIWSLRLDREPLLLRGRERHMGDRQGTDVRGEWKALWRECDTVPGTGMGGENQ